MSTRRPILSVIGSSGPLPDGLEEVCAALGREAIEAGFRVACGGRDGVMEAVCRGARQAPSWRDGDILGVLPSYDRGCANDFVDIVIPTGMQHARNVIVVAMADAVVAVHGGTGTLSEVALAWQLGKPVLALEHSGGWASRLAGQQLDGRRGDCVEAVSTPQQAVARALALVRQPRPEPRPIEP